MIKKVKKSLNTVLTDPDNQDQLLPTRTKVLLQTVQKNQSLKLILKKIKIPLPQLTLKITLMKKNL